MAQVGTLEIPAVKRKKIVYHEHGHGLERWWDLCLAPGSSSDGTCSQWEVALSITGGPFQPM